MDFGVCASEWEEHKEIGNFSDLKEQTVYKTKTLQQSKNLGQG